MRYSTGCPTGPNAVVKIGVASLHQLDVVVKVCTTLRLAAVHEAGPKFIQLSALLLFSAMTRSRHREQWDRLWEITMGALNRTIFSFVVGLAALALLNVMWALSFPLITWKISVWLSTVPFKRQEEERQV